MEVRVVQEQKKKEEEEGEKENEKKKERQIDSASVTTLTNATKYTIQFSAFTF